MLKSNVSNFSSSQLRRALEIKEKIEALEVELGQLLGTAAPAVVAAVAAPVPAPVVKPGRGGRRTLSPEARARIIAAQKRRWAKVKAAKAGKPVAAPATPAAKAKPSRKLSTAGRARLAALAKARWARVKASGKTRL